MTLFKLRAENFKPSFSFAENGGGSGEGVQTVIAFFSFLNGFPYFCVAG